LKIDADQLAKVVINERTGTIVMGATSRWRRSRSRTATSRSRSRRPTKPYRRSVLDRPTVTQTNTTVKTAESGRKLIYISGAGTLSKSSARSTRSASRLAT